MIKDIILEKVYGINSKLEDGILPEVIICGKSNVGKSSFINYLSNRRKIARSSSIPGKTRTINFYKIDSSYYLVDLPGYGYAKVKKEEQDKWSRKIEEYLDFSNKITAAIFLLDIRHEPTSLDKVMYKYLLSRKINILIVLTKSDKIKRSHIIKNIKMIKEKLNCVSPILNYSCRDSKYRDNIINVIENMIGIKNEKN